MGTQHIAVKLLDQDHQQDEQPDLLRIGNQHDYARWDCADKGTEHGDDIGYADECGKQDIVIGNMENLENNISSNADYQGIQQLCADKSAEGIIDQCAHLRDPAVGFFREECAAQFHDLRIALFLGGKQVESDDNSQYEVGNCTDDGRKHREALPDKIFHGVDTEQFSAGSLKEILGISDQVADITLDFACVQIFFCLCFFTEALHPSVQRCVDVRYRGVNIIAPVPQKTLDTVDQFRDNQEEGQENKQ